VSENVKFWALLAGVMLSVSVAVMLIDLSIKAAILEESNTLRKVILGERETKAGSNGASHDVANRSPVLDNDATGLETANVWPRTNGQTPVVSPRKSPRPKPGTQGNPPEIPTGD
jgi:hypothetical protein